MLNKQQYLDRLSEKLLGLPFEERRRIIIYYNEYFEDAGAENEQQVIEDLGEPEKLAKQILADFSVREEVSAPPRVEKKKLPAIWIIILAVFALPIGLPLAIAMFAVLISVFAVIFAVGVTVFAVVGSMVVGGVGMIIAGAGVIFSSFSTGLLFIGLGLLGIGLFCLLISPGIAILRWLFASVGRLFNKITKRGNQ